ncbi:hypothetical protein TRFO_33064 [Tritrichomonas foetus]|uniref:Uncharacterized protein n=1 Tax=Tritrichomonas foetus TaxID=1144522 RepID=A0A1J4JME6_9EUKA|nr:hypothetical protein TRFO_33064 [Tritrichomonas foetus]|eukprot:OHT00279.1 hypothetical protein TRFO_33064 [Tritrichomonas foetus]
MHTNEENRQLKEEISILKEQFENTIDYVPSMTKFYQENTDLQKKLIEQQAANDDLKKRLKIAMENNSDLANKQKKSRSNSEKAYIEEITSLQAQLESAKAEIEKMNSIYQSQIKDLESSNFKSQSESSCHQIQISKILKVAGGYFDSVFKNTDELIEQLKKKPESNHPLANLSNMAELDAENEKEAKIRQLKSKLSNEKQKRNELNLTLLKLKKKNDHERLTSEEQIIKLQDHIRQQANEIQRIELLHQQSSIPTGPPPPKHRNAICQVQLFTQNENKEIEELQHELLKANSKISELTFDLESMKTKCDDLTTQLNEMDTTKMQLIEKLKQMTGEFSESEKQLYLQKKENEQLSILNHELRDKLNQKEADAILPQTQLATKLKFVQADYKNAQSALSNLEKMYDDQKKEIQELSINKEKLIMIIEKQNSLLNGMTEYFENKPTNNEPKVVEKEVTVEPQFQWNVGDLPAEILDIVNEFASNDSLSLESRIKNIFLVINKWIEQQQNIYQKELSSNISKREEIEKAYNKYKTDTISACDDENVDESNICDFISDMIYKNLDLQKENKTIKDNEQRLLDKANVSDFETLIDKTEQAIEQNKKLAEKYDIERKKRLQMKKQFKEYVALKEKDFADKMEMSKRAKENSRKQIEKLQNSIGQLQEQNKELINQIKQSPNGKDDSDEEYKLREKQAEMYRKREEERELEFSMNLSQTQKIGYENDELKAQVQSLNKTIQSWQDQYKEMHNENESLQQKLENQRNEYEEFISQLTKKNDQDNNQNRETIQNLTEKLKVQAEDHKAALDKLNASLIESNKLYEKVFQEKSKVAFEKERMQHSANLKMEAVERAKKLSEAQLKAQLLSIDSKYSMIVEEEKQKAEKKKRELIEYFIGTFRQFSDVDSSLNEESFKQVVKKVQNQFEKNERVETAIRKLIKASEDEPIEDALTQFIIKNHPQFQMK